MWIQKNWLSVNIRLLLGTTSALINYILGIQDRYGPAKDD